MSRGDFSTCIYEKTHLISVYSSNQICEERNVAIIVSESQDCLVVKLRDVDSFHFNYTAIIDNSVFQSMRNQQSLDINYNEFRSQLVEMLQQCSKKEMFIKCDRNDNNCKLIFYGKSKIKNLIFLIVHLDVTDQSQIIDEMNSKLSQLQQDNFNLSNQLKLLKKQHQDTERLNNELYNCNRNTMKEICSQLKLLEFQIVPQIISDFNIKSSIVINRIDRKIDKLKGDLQTVKKECCLKSTASARVLQSLENLRIESAEHAEIVANLKRENGNLLSLKQNHEQVVSDLRQVISVRDKSVCDMQKQIEELTKDLQEATIIIAQKSKTNDEIAKDLVQANQMLVNFNNHYDNKVKEVEDLKEALITKDQMIKDQTRRHTELVNDFQEYKVRHNVGSEQKLNHELFSARKRIEELEKQNREAAKLNGLLTRKLSTGSQLNFDKM